jgi:hypothetical protein
VLSSCKWDLAVHAHFFLGAREAKAMFKNSKIGLVFIMLGVFG